MPKISALTSLAQASVDTAADVLPIVDATAPATTKKVTVQAMVNAGLAAAAPQGGIFALTGALTVSGTSTLTALTTTGSVGIGGAAPATTVLRLSKQGTGGTIAFGQDIQTQVQSDVTNSYSSVRSVSSTAATAFTLSQFNHFSAVQGVIGAGSTVTNQMGFEAQSSLTGAANNFGFYSNLASGTGRWNFYAAGTAANYFAGATTFADTLTVSGQSVFSAANAGLELGAKASANTPFIDFNSSGNSNDYDARIIASAGTTAGTGNLTVFLNSFNISGALGVTGQSTFAAGTAAAPSVKVGAGNEGLYSLAAGSLGLAASGRLALRLETVTNSVNYLYGYANATGGVPVLRSIGSDTNVGLGFGTQGTGPFAFYSHGATTLQFLVASVANATNYWQASGAATGGFAQLTATGTDTNVNAAYVTKGLGAHFFYSGAAPLLALASGGAAGVNYLQVQGGVTGVAPSILSQGTDTNINVTIASKGTGNVGLYTGSGAVGAFFVTHTASGVNWIQATGSTTGNAPTFSVNGSDANIDFAITPKGTGNVRFGTHSALAAETVTGYITIKDSAGNTRKLAVVS